MEEKKGGGRKGTCDVLMVADNCQLILLILVLTTLSPGNHGSFSVPPGSGHLAGGYLLEEKTRKRH